MNGERLYCYGRIEQKCNHVMHILIDTLEIGTQRSIVAFSHSDSFFLGHVTKHIIGLTGGNLVSYRAGDWTKI